MPSVFGDILTATKTRLEAIAGIPTVKIRKKPVLVQEDTIPLVLVTPGRERIGMEAFDTVVEYIYEVQVTVIRAGNRIYESDVQSFLELRQSIRNTLYQPLLAGAATVIDINMETSPPFDIVSGDANNYDISGIIVKYKSIEQRVS
jgi:hypothetical protein